MPTFKVTETLTTVYFVEADSPDEARDVYVMEKHNEVVDSEVTVERVDSNPWQS